MNNILEIIIIVGPIFLLMGLGMLMRAFVRKELLWARAEKLLVNIMLPILLIYVLTDMRRIYEYQWELVQLIIAVTVIAMIVAAGWARVTNAARADIIGAVQGVMQHNIFIACAGVLFGYGFNGLKTAVFIASILIVFFSIGNVCVAQFAGARMRFKEAFKKAIWNPPVMACLISYFMMFEYIRLPEVIDDPLGMIAQATLPFGLIIAGTKLLGATGKLPWKSAFPSALIKILLMPALVAALAPWFGVSGSEAFVGVALIFAVTPVTFALYVEGSKMDPNLQIATIRLQTLGFVLTLPFWLELTNYLP